jgi:hypothetical protein
VKKYLYFINDKDKSDVKKCVKENKMLKKIKKKEDKKDEKITNRNK